MQIEEGSRLGRYRVLHELGSGGMGAVYAAEDTRLKRRVALKILPPELAADGERRARFAREAETLAALDHPGIVTVYSVEESDGVWFLTMPLIAGRTLAELIPAAGLPAARFFELAIPLTRAVAAAHEQGVTHRDLKPANVMVADDGRLTVLDFGLARPGQGAITVGSGAAEDAATALQMTAEGRILGTVAYMSPEQAQGLPVDPRSDIFALGVMFTEMLTGRLPFAGDTGVALMSSILKDTPAEVTEMRLDLPEHLGRIVRRCLAKDPERRYQTAKDVANELEDLREELGARALPPSAPAPAAIDHSITPASWHRWAVVAALAGLVLVAGWTASQLMESGRPDPVRRRGGDGRIRSIVALPADVLGMPELDYLADAIPRSLSSQLTGLADLEVKRPPGSLELELSGREFADLARAYATDALVTSSLSAGGEGLILRLRIVSGADREVLWESELAGAADAPFEVIGRAAAELRAAVRPGQVARTSVTGSTASTPAEMQLRRGQYLSNRYTNLREPADFDLALASFERALELEPTLAAAAVEIANLHIFRLEAGDAGALAEVRRWSDRALQLDPRSSGGWGVRSYVEGRQHVPDQARRLQAALKAVAYGPNDPRAHEFLASAINEGDFSSLLARRAYAETARRDPLYLNPRLAEAGILIGLGRAAEARLLVDRVLELEPGMPLALLVRSWALSALGRVQEAATLAEEVDRYVEEGRIEAAANGLSLAVRALDRNDMDAFRILYEPFRRMAADPAVPHWVKRYAITMVSELARHGQVELTIELMSTFEDAGMVQSYDGLILSPVWDPVRHDPGFQAMLTGSRQQWQETQRLLVAARARGELPAYLDEELADLQERLRLAGR